MTIALTSEQCALLRTVLSSDLSSTAKLTWILLATFGADPHPGKATLAGELGVAKRTIELAFRELRQGWLHELHGKAGGNQTLHVQLRVIEGGANGARGAIAGSPLNVVAGAIPRSIDRPLRPEQAIARSPEIEEELNSRSSSLVPASEEEERNSLRAQKQDGESVLLDLAVDEDLASFWPGSTAEQRLEALLQGTEAKRRDGRPFVQVDAGLRVLRLQAAGHLRYYARTALRHQAGDAGPRASSPPAPRPARPSSPPAPAKDALPDVDPDEFLNNETGVPDLLGMYSAQKAKASAKGGAQ